ncbi:MAG: AAA family ATPase [Dermatophilaceae bacterium]
MVGPTGGADITTGMITADVLNEFGLDVNPNQDPTGQAQPATYVAPAPEDGSVVAQALLRAWRGDPLTVLASGPGCGKTTALVKIIANLVMRAGLHIVVATPTRAQAFSIATALYREIPKGYFTLAVTKVAPGVDLPRDVLDAKLDASRAGIGRVEVRTLSSCESTPPDCDLMAVDEGYQATFASLTTAAANARQLLVVGDSGQIGPVVTVNTAPFTRWGVDPHVRAPEVLLHRRHQKPLTMGTSYRLGPDSVRVVAPLYGFPLTSGRPHRHLATPVGETLPEVAHVDCGRVTSPDDDTLLTAAATRALALTATSRFEATTGATTALTQQNVAVVVSRNTQRTFVRSLLDSMGSPHVVVDTADRLQGGQWTAVVAVDPLAGASDITDHAASAGRLCVMVSRHTTHLTWVHDNSWPSLLSQAGYEQRAGGVQVRNALVASPDV